MLISLKEHIGQYANLDYSLWCFQFIHVLKLHSQSNRGKQQFLFFGQIGN